MNSNNPNPCSFQHNCINFLVAKNGNCAREFDSVLDCWVEYEGKCKITNYGCDYGCDPDSYVCRVTGMTCKPYQNNNGKPYPNFQCFNFKCTEHKGETL